MLKRMLMTALLCSAFTVAVRADDEKPTKPAAPSTPGAPSRPDKRQVTEEQRTLMKEMRAKYDTNKDGKLDASERKAMSAEDKEKLQKALGGTQRRTRTRDGKEPASPGKTPSKE